MLVVDTYLHVQLSQQLSVPPMSVTALFSKWDRMDLKCIQFSAQVISTF